MDTRSSPQPGLTGAILRDCLRLLPPMGLVMAMPVVLLVILQILSEALIGDATEYGRGLPLIAPWLMAPVALLVGIGRIGGEPWLQARSHALPAVLACLLFSVLIVMANAPIAAVSALEATTVLRTTLTESVATILPRLLLLPGFIPAMAMILARGYLAQTMTGVAGDALAAMLMVLALCLGLAGLVALALSAGQQQALQQIPRFADLPLLPYRCRAVFCPVTTPQAMTALMQILVLPVPVFAVAFTAAIIRHRLSLPKAWTLPLKALHRGRRLGRPFDPVAAFD